MQVACGLRSDLRNAVNVNMGKPRLRTNSSGPLLWASCSTPEFVLTNMSMDLLSLAVKEEMYQLSRILAGELMHMLQLENGKNNWPVLDGSRHFPDKT